MDLRGPVSRAQKTGKTSEKPGFLGVFAAPRTDRQVAKLSARHHARVIKSF
jgi:hypothetical protein